MTIFNRTSYKFIHYSHDPSDSTSLSGNRVCYTYEDTEGTIWIATDGSGLNKAIVMPNGKVQFKRYQHTQENPASISSNYIFRLFEDNTDNLWILSGANIDRYDRNRDIFLHLDLHYDCINQGDYETEETQNELLFPVR